MPETTCPACGKDPTIGIHIRVGNTCADLARVETIMRDHAMHEPTCSVRAAQKHNAQGGTYMAPKPCDCWLSNTHVRYDSDEFDYAGCVVCDANGDTLGWPCPTVRAQQEPR